MRKVVLEHGDSSFIQNWRVIITSVFILVCVIMSYLAATRVWTASVSVVTLRDICVIRSKRCKLAAFYSQKQCRKGDFITKM